MKEGQLKVDHWNPDKVSPTPTGSAHQSTRPLPPFSIPLNLKQRAGLPRSRFSQISSPMLRLRITMATKESTMRATQSLSSRRGKVLTTVQRDGSCEWRTL